MTRSEMNKLSRCSRSSRSSPACRSGSSVWGSRRRSKYQMEMSLGFVILAKDGVEIMYQSRASVEKDIPPMARGSASGLPAMGLFIEVGNIDEVERSLEGIEHVIPRRRTFYGMDEVVVRDPGGYVVVFAQPVAANA